MECSSMAVASCFRLIATILLLAMAGRCSSQQMDHIQLSRIADSIDDLTQVVQAQAVDSEKVAAGIMEKFTSVATAFIKVRGRSVRSLPGLSSICFHRSSSSWVSQPVMTSVFSTQAVASAKVASGIMKMFTLMATNHLVCERGWFKLRSSCYFISKDTSTWEESRQKCIALNSDLVKITHDEEYIFLRDLVKGHSTYIGLSDLQEQSTYRWVVDGTIHQIVKSWWDKDEPNNPAERCVHYNHLQDDRLNDVNCSWKYRYICKKPAQLPWNFASVLDEEMPADK